MIGRRLEAVGAEDIRALIANGVRESRTLEYKRELPSGGDTARKEFLADVSSFANSNGGDILYGIEADGGVPRRVCGLNGFDADKDALRLDSMIRDGLDPRIMGVRLKVIETPDDGPVLLIRVPKTWTSPHMVTFKGASRFYTRSTAGKSLMDVDELRSAFALSADLPARIRAWRDERIALIVAGETPVCLTGASHMALHIAPIDSFTSSRQIPVSELVEHSGGWQPMNVSGWNRRINLGGVVTLGGGNRDESIAQSYCQVFRSGRVEAVCSDLVRERNGQKGIGSVWYEKELLEAAARYMRGILGLGAEPPFVILVTLIGVRGATLFTGDFLRDAYPIERNVLLLPDVIIDALPVDLSVTMRPILDSIWNASGLLRSFNFDDAGTWVHGHLDCSVGGTSA